MKRVALSVAVYVIGSMAILGGYVASRPINEPAPPTVLEAGTSSIGFPVPAMRIIGRPSFTARGETPETYHEKGYELVRVLLSPSTMEHRVCLTTEDVRTRCWAAWQLLDDDGWTVIPVERLLSPSRTFLSVLIARDTRIWGRDEYGESVSTVVLDRVRLSSLPTIQWTSKRRSVGSLDYLDLRSRGGSRAETAGIAPGSHSSSFLTLQATPTRQYSDAAYVLNRTARLEVL